MAWAGSAVADADEWRVDHRLAAAHIRQSASIMTARWRSIAVHVAGDTTAHGVPCRRSWRAMRRPVSRDASGHGG
ncbi:MAG: hypothetical protein C0521_09515 [Xanthomonas sp.]|nr:hypothetical protein [Xanthomonas sp.]